MTSSGLDGRTQRRLDNAARLYDSAARLLETKSFDALAVDEICDHAGVARSTFFRIFTTKAGLLMEFNRRIASDAATRLATTDSTDLRFRLDLVRQAILGAWLTAGPGHLDMAKAFMQSDQNTDLHGAHPDLIALVIAELTSAGHLRDDVPIDVQAQMLIVHLVVALSHVVSGRHPDGERLSSALLDQWLAGALDDGSATSRSSDSAGRPSNSRENP